MQSRLFTACDDSENTSEFYKLELTRLIETMDNPEYKGKVLAYFEPRFLHLAASRMLPMTESVSFLTYSNYAHVDIHDLQRKKYKAMEALVKHLNTNYKQQKRSLHAHSMFCTQLLQVVAFCMSTSEEACRENRQDLPKADCGEAGVLEYWGNLIPKQAGLGTNAHESYYHQLRDLIDYFKQTLAMQHRDKELTDKFNQRSDKKTQGLCISWLYFDVMCNLHGLGKEPSSKDLLDKCKDMYKKENSGLAKDLFYVPDFWDFMIKIKPDHKNNNLGTLLKGIINMFNNYPEFKECKPEENKGFSRVFSNTR